MRNKMMSPHTWNIRKTGSQTRGNSTTYLALAYQIILGTLFCDKSEATKAFFC